VLLWLATYFALNGTTRSPYVTYRLDVLQGIGAALVAVNGVLWVVSRWKHAALVLALLAIFVALATPSFVGVDLWWMPTRVADYVARTTVDPAHSAARFPLFPWLGYTLLGAAVGVALRARPLASAWEVPFVRAGWIAVVVAVAVGLCVFEPMPFAQWLLFYTEQVRNLLRLAWNATVALGFAGVSSLVLPRLRMAERAVLSLGRHSLVVYVVHLEIAFGLPCVPIRETLGFGGWAIGGSLLLAAMIALAYTLDWQDTRSRPNAEAARAPASAM
jgi:uncharacterized membrane protein